jgi:hypothetical protein
MLLREAFILEGQRDKEFRDLAKREYESALRDINRLHIEPITGPNDSMYPLEVGYYVSNACDACDLIVVFTIDEYDRPKGQYWPEGSFYLTERPVIALFHKEEKNNLIKRKMMADRSRLEKTNSAVEKILSKMRHTFIHEYVHNIDLNRMGDYTPRERPNVDDSMEEKQRKWSELYNSPLEYNAHFQAIADAIENSVKRSPQNWPMDSQQFYFRAMKFIEQNYPLFWGYLLDENRRKMQKRIMQLWLDIRGSG